MPGTGCAGTSSRSGALTWLLIVIVPRSPRTCGCRRSSATRTRSTPDRRCRTPAAALAAAPDGHRRPRSGHLLSRGLRGAGLADRRCGWRYSSRCSSDCSSGRSPATTEATDSAHHANGRHVPGLPLHPVRDPAALGGSSGAEVRGISRSSSPSVSSAGRLSRACSGLDPLCQGERLRRRGACARRERCAADVRHIMPNAVAPIIVYATMSIGGAILTEAALSFLGLGIQPDPG